MSKTPIKSVRTTKKRKLSSPEPEWVDNTGPSESSPSFTASAPIEHQNAREEIHLPWISVKQSEFGSTLMTSFLAHTKDTIGEIAKLDRAAKRQEDHSAALQQQIKSQNVAILYLKKELQSSEQRLNSQQQSLGGHAIGIATKDKRIQHLEEQTIDLQRRLEGKCLEIEELVNKENAHKIQESNIGVLRRENQELRKHEWESTQALKHVSDILPNIQSDVDTIITYLKESEAHQQDIKLNYDDYSKKNLLSCLSESKTSTEKGKSNATKASTSLKEVSSNILQLTEVRERDTPRSYAQASPSAPSSDPGTRQISGSLITANPPMAPAAMLVGGLSHYRPVTPIERTEDGISYPDRWRPGQPKTPSALVIHRISKGKYCNNYHLWNNCPNSDECKHKHGARLEDEELQALHLLSSNLK